MLKETPTGGFEFYATVEATSVAEGGPEMPVKGLASSSVLDTDDCIITDGAIDRIYRHTQDGDGYIPLTSGTDHYDSLVNALSIVGWGKPVVAKDRGEFIIDGYFKAEHPFAPSIYHDIKNHPGRIKLSVGGFIPQGAVEEKYDETLGRTIRYIHDFRIDHIFVCRGESAINQDTWIEAGSVEDDTTQTAGKGGEASADWGEVLFRASKEVEVRTGVGDTLEAQEAVTPKTEPITDTGKARSTDMPDAMTEDQSVGIFSRIGKAVVTMLAGEESGKAADPAPPATEPAPEPAPAVEPVPTAATEQAAEPAPEAPPTPSQPETQPEPDMATMMEQVVQAVGGQITNLNTTLQQSLDAVNARLDAVEKPTAEPEPAPATEPAPTPGPTPADPDPAPSGEEPKTPITYEQVQELVGDLEQHFDVIYGQLKELRERQDASMKARGHSDQVPITGEPAPQHDNETSKSDSVANIIGRLPAD